MNRLDYWIECISCALDEIDLPLTKEQIEHLAKAVEGGHECYGMAFYQPEHPAVGELARTQAELKAERALVFCVECQGSGRLRYNSGPWAVDTQCHKCNGNGKHR